MVTLKRNEWSRLPEYAIIDTSALFNYINVKQKEWEKFIGESDESDEVAVIRKYTMTGRPLGGVSFIQKLEKVFDKKLHALPVGRPKGSINKKIGVCP